MNNSNKTGSKIVSYFINSFKTAESLINNLLLFALGVVFTFFVVYFFPINSDQVQQTVISDKYNNLCKLNLYSYCYSDPSHPYSNNYLSLIEQIANGANQRNISEDIIRMSTANIKYQEPTTKNSYYHDSSLHSLSDEINTEVISIVLQQYKEHKDVINKIAYKYQVNPYILGTIWILDKMDFAKGSNNIFSELIAKLNAVNFSYDISSQIYVAMEILNQYPNLHSYQLLVGPQGYLGATHFLPQHYLDYAVDVNQDGIADVWFNDIESLSSIANYLKSNSWDQNLGIDNYSVITPTDFYWDINFLNLGICQGSNILISDGHSLDNWHAKGMLQDNKMLLPTLDLDSNFYFLGSKLERIGNYWHGFLVNKNYFILMNYACSARYALKVSIISKILATLDL